MQRDARLISYRLSLLLVVGAALVFSAWAAAAGVVASGPLFVSPAGNDANNCQTFSTACLTIGAAVGKASAGNIIIIASGVYTESVTLDKNLTLIGFGGDATFISGGGTQQVLQIPAGVTVSLYDIVIVRGFPGIVNAGVLTFANSLVADNVDVGLVNEGQVTINFSSIRDNHAFNGAGLSNSNGTAIVSNSTILSNSVKAFGGGILNDGGNLSINNTIIANNVNCNQACPFTAVQRPNSKIPVNGYFSEGGGIDSSGGTLSILNSTISSNTVLYGSDGGLSNNSRAVISNTTISGNTAPFGAGIRNAYFMTLTNVTLTGNMDQNIDNDGTLWLQNTIVANGTSSGCSGNPVISLGHNLDSANSCGLNASGDLTNTNPLLGPLQDNGGPTPTQALLPGSPAINAGTNLGCPATDQRGIARPQGGICDIGAYEFVFTDTLFLPVIVR